MRIEEQYEYNDKRQDEVFEKATEDYFNQHLDQTLHCFGVIEDHQIVSVLVFKIVEYAPVIGSDGKEIYIFNAYTKPAYRNQGFTTKNMMEGIEYFKTKGYDCFRLHTAKENARHIYHKLGFHNSTTAMSLFIESGK